jgi:hypothetical protein
VPLTRKAYTSRVLGADVFCLRRVGRLSVQAAVRAMGVVVVLRFLQLVVEDPGIVDNDTFEEPVELFDVNDRTTDVTVA